MGVWAKLNSSVGDLLNNTSGNSGELVSNSTIFGCAVLIGLVNIVLMTTMAAIAAFVYNLSTDLVGGVEVTLAGWPVRQRISQRPGPGRWAVGCSQTRQ
ncbi:DUF3566 domain-containing protein [Actinomadura welshii]